MLSLSSFATRPAPDTNGFNESEAQACPIQTALPSQKLSTSDGSTRIQSQVHLLTYSTQCDRRQPECTQCVRLSKTCPGYRDQLSLMFRDETVKVEKRVRASWGLGDSSSIASSSSGASQTTSARAARFAISASSSKRSNSASIPTPPASNASASPKATTTSHARSESPSPMPPHDGPVQLASFVPRGAYRPGTPYQSIATEPTQLGVSFYIQHYLLGYPDEVRSPAELNGIEWFEHPSAQSTMAAMGLAALGNLGDDKKLQHISKIKYGEALAGTNETLRDPVKYLDTAIRTTVMLALFQVSRLFTALCALPVRGVPERTRLTLWLFCASSVFTPDTSPTRTRGYISWAAWP